MGEIESNKSFRILVADDSRESMLLVLAFLKALPCLPQEAANGAQALEKFQSESFDLILMDAEMPEMNGYDAVRAIRALEKENGKKPVPILMMTGNVYEEDVEMALEAGCDGHIPKPLRRPAFLETIQRYLDSSASAWKRGFGKPA